jgi:hypothetical protein
MIIRHEIGKPCSIISNDRCISLYVEREIHNTTVVLDVVRENISGMIRHLRFIAVTQMNEMQICLLAHILQPIHYTGHIPEIQWNQWVQIIWLHASLCLRKSCHMSKQLMRGLELHGTLHAFTVPINKQEINFGNFYPKTIIL